MAQQQQPLPYNVIWSSLRCDEFPPTNLTKIDSSVSATGSSSSSLSLPPTFFQTDKATDRIIIRLDFGQNVCIRGCMVRSSSASRIFVRAAYPANHHDAKFDDVAPTTSSTNDFSGFCQRGHQLLQEKQFVSPIAHRARLLALRESNGSVSRLPPIELQLENILRDAYKRRTLVNGDKEMYQKYLELKEKRGIVDPPCFSRFVDVDIRGEWEPNQRLGLDSLRFVGHYVSLDEVKEYFDKAKRIRDAFLAQQQQQQQQQQTQGTQQTNNNNKNVATKVEGGVRRERQNDEENENDQNTQKQTQNKPPPKKAENINIINNDKWDDVLNPAKKTNNIIVDNNNNNSQQQQPLKPSNFGDSQQQQNQKPATKFSEKPLANVTFVLSGFQNPMRGNIRDKAVKLGAKYSNEWDDSCTHLICAVSHTPKYLEVQQSGHGFIVLSNWVDDCELFGERCKEDTYKCGDGGPDNKK